MKFVLALNLCWSLFFQVTPQPVVKAVLFYTPGCSYCQAVLDKVFPPLQVKYGARLEIQKVPLSSVEDIDRLYAAASAYNLKKEDIMVPFLVVGSQALVGEEAITARFPALIEQGLAQGGIPAPVLPPALAEAAQSPTPAARATPATGLNEGPLPPGAQVASSTPPGCSSDPAVGCAVSSFATQPAPVVTGAGNNNLVLVLGGGLAVALVVGGGVWLLLARRAAPVDDGQAEGEEQE